jgi:hypothetical protein
MDPTILITAIAAGAAAAGTEAVKEATKDAYRGLKSAMTDVLGKRAQRSIEKVEASPGEESARSDLKALVPSLPAEDVPEVEQKLATLLAAFGTDPAVKPIVESVARIKLDVDAGGNVTLEYLAGAREIDVKAKAGNDFVLRGVKMDRGPDSGN